MDPEVRWSYCEVGSPGNVICANEVALAPVVSGVECR
jgi:hypothetical protein